VPHKSVTLSRLIEDLSVPEIREALGAQQAIRSSDHCDPFAMMALGMCDPVRARRAFRAFLEDRLWVTPADVVLVSAAMIASRFNVSKRTGMRGLARIQGQLSKVIPEYWCSYPDVWLRFLTHDLKSLHLKGSRWTRHNRDGVWRAGEVEALLESALERESHGALIQLLLHFWHWPDMGNFASRIVKQRAMLRVELKKCTPFVHGLILKRLGRIVLISRFWRGERGDPEEGIELMTLGESLTSGGDEWELNAAILSEIGSGYNTLGKPSVAIEYFLRSQERLSARGEAALPFLGDCHGGLISAYAELGDSQRELDHLILSLRARSGYTPEATMRGILKFYDSTGYHIPLQAMGKLLPRIDGATQLIGRGERLLANDNGSGAESCFLEAMAISRSCQGAQYWIALSRLGDVYSWRGWTGLAEYLKLQALVHVPPSRRSEALEDYLRSCRRHALEPMHPPSG